ncbi:CmcJ/NvfI family oxidoreductase [Pacificoceanicola onchidii]|uniref:CmcJ/NvfI family oxidoreductase n=1 Tax=Pacificoceanicola onchidii TaxID=2562685 RepID=UPI0010A5F88B|nr:CmcJ/NvfI family oxidoreductase [Pacificoceanicola onchidii]
MLRQGHVNYHVHKPERQAFHIDAGGVVGKLLSPELKETRITVRDVRSADVHADFASDSVSFVESPTSVTDFSDPARWQATYDAELTTLLKDSLGAREVIIFDHTVRTDDPEATRKPARNVHSDYSVDGARQRLIDILGPEEAEVWSQGHYAFINVWRPVGNPINSAPLGFLRPSSVPEQDWLLLDLIYPDRKGQIMGIVGGPTHEWLYMSKMTPNDVAVFNIYDNKGQPSIAHSAIDLVEDESVTTIRQSLESRTLIRY